MINQRGVIAIGVVILALVAFLGFSSSLTGMAVSNSFRQGGSLSEFQLSVGENIQAFGKTVMLDSVEKGKTRHDDNIKILVDGKPAFIKRDSIQHVKGLRIIGNNFDVYNGKAMLIISPAKQIKTAPNSIKESLDDFDLADYPSPFVNENKVTHNSLLIVAGMSDSAIDAANIVANGIEDITGKMPSVERTETRGSTSNKVIRHSGDFNRILVGQPCDNNLIAELLETDRCDAGLKNGYGLIEIKPGGNKATMIVTGGSGDDVVKAARALKDYYKLNRNVFTGDYVFVTGISEEPEFSKY